MRLVSRGGCSGRGADHDGPGSTPDRWTVRSRADPPAGSGDVAALLRRAADYIESLGPGYVADLALAAEVDARTVIDLGCGTGRLATKLATNGRRVIGVDPAPAMIDVARKQPGAERVQWLVGDAGVLGTPDADLAVMTGNIPSVFVDDCAWDAALRALHAALRPSGYLAFGSRNPEALPWESWNTNGVEVVQPDIGAGITAEVDHEVISVEAGRVRVVGHIVFDATGDVLVAGSEYRYRTLNELTDSLTHAGVVVEGTYGDWQYSQLSDTSPHLVLIAKRV